MSAPIAPRPAGAPAAPPAEDPWRDLRRFTAARIAMGRAGGSQPTRAQLAFQLDHARARDAVLRELDAGALAQRLATTDLETLVLSSAAPDRATYIARPDLGRVLDDASAAALAARPAPERPWDVAFAIADGLSALAVERHAPPLLERLLPRLAAMRWSVAPLAIVRQGRVAVADHVGELLGARLAVILIGERPGLSSPDSLGLYLTWQPRRGRSNAERNCISNVREPGGLDYARAAHTAAHLMTQARRLESSGVALKDDAPQLAQDAAPG